MNLTIKDLVATVFTGLTGYVAYLSYVNAKMPFISSYRWGIVILGVIGIGVCAFSATSMTSGTMATILSGLGIAAIIAVIAGLITNSQVAFLSLAGIIILLWLLTTLRHALS